MNQDDKNLIEKILDTTIISFVTTNERIIKAIDTEGSLWELYEWETDLWIEISHPKGAHKKLRKRVEGNDFSKVVVLLKLYRTLTRQTDEKVPF